MDEKGMVDALKRRIDNAEHFKPLFDNDLFKEFLDILTKKEERYVQMRRDVPKVGDIQKYDEVQQFSTGGTITTKKIFKVTLDEQLEREKEMTYRADEVNLILNIPRDIELDKKRAQDELKRMEQK